ncbi:MAG: hypothetical protein GC179_25880 [Anaerolineaceae bacterium]|nr:hypothetical protein [Anaerolineaceae bacterium]
MPVDPPQAKYCLFTDLNNGIWEFRFLKSRNEAVDEWVAWQNYLSTLPPKPEIDEVRTLLDFRPDGMISMMYALQKNAEWRRQNPHIQPIPVKVALVLRPMNGLQKTYADLIKEGVNAFGMRKVQVELFPNAYRQAIDWLLEN